MKQISLALLGLHAMLCGGLIDIGSEKQLFLDDYLIEHSDHVAQVLHPAIKIDPKPVIPQDLPWEGNNTFIKYVCYDDKDQAFKMWYTTSSMVSRQGAKGRIVVEPSKKSVNAICFATSKDGFHWEKPDLHQVEFQGSTKNNIVKPTELYGMFLDPHETDPAKRFKGMHRYIDFDSELIAKIQSENARYYTVSDKWLEQARKKNRIGATLWDLYYSPDGFQWTPYENNPVIKDPPFQWTMAGPTRFMWDPLRKTYAAHVEISQHSRSTDFDRFGRVVGRVESPDMIHWGLPETIIIPDEKDAHPTQFYDSAILTHAGMYIGLTAKYNKISGEIRPELISSRNGIHYERRFRDRPFIPLGATGSFDSLEIYPTVPIVYGNHVFTFYTGRMSGHERGPFYEREMGSEHTFSAIGLARIPLDRFVSNDAGKRGGELTTRAFTFTGNKLHLNVSGRPNFMKVHVEVLGAASHLIPGLRFEDSDPIITDGLDHVVTWNGQSDLSHLKGKPVKLRFRFKQAKLFSFQFR